METYMMRDFIDIAEFTLTGEDQYITIEIMPVGNVPIQTFDEMSVGQVQVTGDLLTPCYYFLEECQDMDSLDEFDLNAQIQLEEMVIEQVDEDCESSQDLKVEQSTVGFDLLDVLQKQYEKLLQRKLGETCQNEILSSSTSVNGETNTHKSEDFETNQFQENLDYPFETRRDKVQRYLKKRKNRNWNKKISYKCRKQVADSRLRVKGRFITRQQANKLLGLNTNGMSIDLIRTLLESKFGKEKDSEADDLSDKVQFILTQ